MPITREEKEKLIAELADEFGKAQALILTDYRGLPTTQIAGLRNQLRPMHSGLHVAKNTLVALALQRAGLPVPEDLLAGPTAIAFCNTDISGTAKALNDFLKDKDVKIKGAIMGGRILRGTEANALATLPTREQILGRLLGTINAPGGQAAGVVAAGIRQILYMLQARVDQLKSNPPAEQPAPAGG
ncbi:MAG: 50S ribosomal protein L10 [Chloroflexi bacterium]|nr:50S ribosomal protein L10 [Chloroflexota bacterium]